MALYQDRSQVDPLLVTKSIFPGHSAVSRLRRLLISIAVGATVLSIADARAQSETEFYDSGMGLLGEKKLAGAEAEFRKAVSADPRYKEAWQALADVLRTEGKLEQANAVQTIAAAAPESRSGKAPALSADQQRALSAPHGLASARAPALVALPEKAPELHAARQAPITALPRLAPKARHLIGRAVSEDGRPIPQFTVAYSGFEDV
jgi:thioredoxin-like negative regulator of GroEL